MAIAEPLISVLVPTYNDGQMLITALESIQRQTFADFEVIVGDDGSANNTADLAEVFCESDERFRCIRYSNNVGMTPHWNRLAKEAIGEFVCKLDGDDAYQPEMLERLLKSLLKNGTKIGFCRTIDCNAALEPVASYYGERALLRSGIEPQEDYVRKGSEWLPLCFDGFQLWHSNAFLVARKTFQKLSGWDERWGCASDTDFILRLLETDQEVSVISYAGVLYRRRKGSVLDTFRQNSWHHLESAVVHLESLDRMSQQQPAVGRKLRRQWVHYWTIWSREVNAFADGTRDFHGLRAADINVCPPPMAYRVMEHLYQAASQIKRLVSFR